jgi:2,4-dienoyl-CoA reductase [(3E)-enoyl-CoA-producing], peroxisomal
LKQYGKLDILVNGAAGNFLCPPEALSPNAFKTVIDIDLIGTFHMARASFEALKASGDALIINITATLQLRGSPFQAHAMAAKAGVDALTKGLAADWGEFGIRVVGIAPGATKGTEGLKRLVPGAVDKMVQTIVPLRKIGTKKEVGLTAVYLSTEAAKYVTGSNILCEGGEALFYPRVVSRETLLQAMASKNASKSKL